MGIGPEPDEIYERTRREGRRRLSRPLLELSATSLLGGFDVAFGALALGVTWGLVAPRIGDDAGQAVGALAFPIAFLFIVVGRSELFTENFLVPIAGLEQRGRDWWKLAELWGVTLALNLAGGIGLAVLLTWDGVLPDGTGHALSTLAAHVAERGFVAASISALAAGALMTLMTWLVVASDSMAVRIITAWAVGFLIAAASFNHAIVSTIELVAGQRYGGGVTWGVIGVNLAVSAVGNLVGGLLFVTFTRFGQAAGAGTKRSSA